MTNQRRQLYNDGYVQVFQEGFTLYAKWVREPITELQEYQKINLERRLDMVSKAVYRKPLQRIKITQTIKNSEPALMVPLDV